MSTQEPIGSVPPERPRDPTHFGGEGLYEPLADTDKSADRVGDSSLKIPLGEQMDEPTKDVLQGRSAQDTLWDFARRKHVPALLAAGGIVWLLGVLIRRSTRLP